VKERPILFSGPMVRAILDGSKTQTRRMVKDAQPAGIGRCHWSNTGWAHLRLSGGCSCQPVHCPHGTPGDRLWVRETWAHERDGTGCPDDTGVLYRATDPGWDDEGTGLRWRPSIFMPRIASRILLEITDVRVQRLQEISDEDARAEGIDLQGFRSLTEGIAGREHRIKFHDLWEDIHGDGSWNTNPWVWAITFRRLEP
jgi:hypothetical protein